MGPAQAFGSFETISLFIIFAVLGLCFGSFVTALIYRIPRKISWISDASLDGPKGARSICPCCKAQLTILDLIPFFSWLFLRGQCRHCKAVIPAVYPLTELATMVALLCLYAVWGLKIEAVPVYLCVPILMAALVIDWRHMILPDSLNIILVGLGLSYVVLIWFNKIQSGTVVSNHIIAAIVLPLIFLMVSYGVSHWKKRAALGMGDVKFMVPVGLFLGITAVPSFMAFSGVIGIVTAFLKRDTLQGGAFPFGPALIISFYIHLFLTGLGFDYKVIY